MAASASSSSDENSKAPNLNVQVSSDDDNDVVDGLVALGHNKRSANVTDCGLTTSTPLRCPLCRRSQQRLRFHCRSCVRNGNIVHSTGVCGTGGKLQRESLSEKQQKYLKYQASLKEFCQSYEQRIKEQRSVENVQFEIKRKKEKLNLLNTLVKKKKAKLLALGEQRDQMQKANMERRKHLPNYPIKVRELEDYVLDRIEKIGKLRDKHTTHLGKLREVTRRGIHQLVEYIFPISEVVLKEERQRDTTPRTTEDSETIAALADAKNTSYIRGKWVIHGSGISEVQYRIVSPSLPANGDYTAYLEWLNENKDDVPKTTANENTSRVTAFRIVGALTYTTQLTQLMSYYLNVRLPHKLAYGDFCKKLNAEQFLRKVSRLNSNVMYLAYTQKVQLRTLSENHTLENLLAILDVDKSDLGHHGYHEVTNAPLAESIDSLFMAIDTTTESESEDDNSLRFDWEAVPHLPAQSDIINTHVPAIAMAGQQSTTAESLMTSAANRFTSIFRWMK